MSHPEVEHELEQEEPEQQPNHIPRRNVLKTGAITAGALTLGNIASARRIASSSELHSNGDTADGTGNDSRGGSHSKSETLITQLNAVYLATRKYRSVAAAREDGYAQAMVVPNVGHIFAINDRIKDGEVNIVEPEALVYVDTRTTGCGGDPADADLNLAAIEYVVPGHRAENPPDLFADENTSYLLKVTEEEGWHNNEEIPVTGLHVWLHHWNLAGLFSLTNPAVSEESSLKGRADQ